jgi:hypothetical protein
MGLVKTRQVVGMTMSSHRGEEWQIVADKLQHHQIPISLTSLIPFQLEIPILLDADT